MSLTEEILALKTAAMGQIPAEKLDVMLSCTNELQEQKISEKALKKGDKLPAFKLSDATGKEVSSADLLAKGGIVLSFYRGGWCPYCNLELKALQNALSEINAKGYELVAITPETPDNSLSTQEKNELKFSVLSDIDNKYAKEAGLVFQMQEDLRAIYHEFGLDIPKYNGNQDYELPMPATYVVNAEGEIIYSFVAEDYSERADPVDVLKAL